MTLASTRVVGITAIVIATTVMCRSEADAQDVLCDDTQPIPDRPTIMPDRRWAEDWSVLADPRTAREPLDGLKYMPFSTDHPRTYLSLGLNLRERLEVDHAPFFGIPPGEKGQWVLSRLEWHTDLRLEDHVQVFAQFQSAYAPGKPVLSAVDQDRLDVEQAFVGVSEPLYGGSLRLRFGRQLIPIDLQRFASVRDGPNLRQSYDAAYADYERGPWFVTGAYTRPVQTRDVRAFDDYSDPVLTFSGILLRRRVHGWGQLSASYTRYSREGAAFANVTGDERRDSLDIRFSGARKGLDWDIEGMNQTGRIATQAIAARAFGALGGYTFVGIRWTPRLGVSADVATGDHDPRDNTLETFNPLFPNGYYLADYTGYPNLIHVKPAVTLHPSHAVNVMIAAAEQWRQTTRDAIYIFPSVPLPGTADTPGRYTGKYVEVRGDWIITPHYSVGLDGVHYASGSAIRTAGGRDANYVSVEIRYGW